MAGNREAGGFVNSAVSRLFWNAREGVGGGVGEWGRDCAHAS